MVYCLTVVCGLQYLLWIAILTPENLSVKVGPVKKNLATPCVIVVSSLQRVLGITTTVSGKREMHLDTWRIFSMERVAGFQTTTVTDCREANLSIVVVVEGVGERTVGVHDALSIAAGTVVSPVQ